MATTTGLDPATDLPAADAPWIAPWWRRVLATVLDGWVVGTVTFLLGGHGDFGPAAPMLGPVAGDGPGLRGTAAWPVALVALGLLLACQGWTGATPGKRVLGIAVVRRADGRPTGLLGAVGRALLHLLDAVLLIGYLRPLWHPRGWTFADGLAGTEVVQTRVVPRTRWVERVAGPRGPGRPSLPVTIAAAAACALAAGFATVTTSGPSTGVASCTPGTDGSGPATGTAAAAGPPGALLGADLSWSAGEVHETRLGVTRRFRSDDAALDVSWRLDDVPDGAVRLGLRIETRTGEPPRVATVDLRDGVPQRVDTPHGVATADGVLDTEGTLLGSVDAVMTSHGDGHWSAHLPAALLDGLPDRSAPGDGDEPWRWVAWTEVEGVPVASCESVLP